MPIDRGAFRGRHEALIERHAARREPLVRNAMRAAMAYREKLREALRTNAGIWFPEMAPLHPLERTALIVELRKMWGLRPDPRMRPAEGRPLLDVPHLGRPE